MIMDNNCKALLDALDDELTQKCFELQRQKQEQRMKKWFIALSAMLIIIPVLLVIFDIPFFTYALPILIFLIVGAAIISPFLLAKSYSN